MGKLDELNAMVAGMFTKANEPDVIKELAKTQQILNDAMAEEKSMLEKHQQLKKDYADAVKSTVVTTTSPERGPVKTPSQIVKELGLGDKIRFTDDTI